MESGNMIHRLTAMLQKYKHAVLVVLIGMGLMLLPVGDHSREPTLETEPLGEERVDADLEIRLEQILRKVNGAGDVDVLLTERSGQETFYQTDVQTDRQDQVQHEDVNTVIVKDDSRGETGLIRRRDAPVYQGAVIVCQGGDDPQVRLAVVEAVRCVTGLGANQISVVKMK